ncbi:MAG: hypothetical protein Q4G33_00500 [bacterium]|nr:hypothetical protein [bacterium]
MYRTLGGIGGRGNGGYSSVGKTPAVFKLHGFYTRMEWSVETMHRLLDVHFDEDHCRTQDKNVQFNLNIARKYAINLIKLFKSETGSKN